MKIWVRIFSLFPLIVLITACSGSANSPIAGLYVMDIDGSNQVKLTDSLDGSARSTAWSPDGSRIAFDSLTDEHWTIFVMDADGTGLSQITNNHGDNGFPSWSPDGRDLVFHSNRNGTWQIYGMGADGEAQRGMDVPRGEATTPWGPKYTRTAINPDTFYHVALVFDQSTGTLEGFLNGESFGGVTGVGKLFAHNGDVNIGRAGDATVFHDGTASVGNFFKGVVDEVEVYDRPLSGSDLHGVFALGSLLEVQPGTKMSGLVGWWPGDGNANGVVGVNQDGVLNGASFVLGKVGQAFSFDGVDDSVSIPSSREINIGGPYTQRTVALWFKSSDDVDTRQVLWEEGSLMRGLNIYIDEGFVYVNAWNLSGDDVPGERGAAWSPDGTKIAYHSRIDGNWHIYVMNAAGSGQSRLTDNDADNSFAAWSTEGGKIAFHSDRDGDFDIYTMNADGSGQINLTNNDFVADLHPDWSPDGSKIVFSSNRDGNLEIYTMSADGSDAVRLTNNDSTDGFPAWSPDGLRIIFSSERGG